MEQQPREVVRPAARADSAQLCRFFAGSTMEAALQLSVEREPDFFALYDAQEGEGRTWVLEMDGDIAGIGTVLARDGWLHGRRLRVGYAGDLRLTPKKRDGFFFASHFGRLFAECCAELGCEVALTAVIESNRAARRALVDRHPRFPTKPVYKLLRRFGITNVQFTLPRRPRRSAYEVRQATLDDLPAIAARLASDHHERPFGYVFDTEVLERRLRRWPGLEIGSFYLAFDRERRLVGVVAPWDAQAIKRYRVLAYRGHMRAVRFGADAIARLSGGARLPPPGGLFRYFYLTHVSIENDDPAIYAALVDRVYADWRGRGYHFFTTVEYEQDALAPALARYRRTRLEAGLYTMTVPGGRYEAYDFGAGRPGFEAALV